MMTLYTSASLARDPIAILYYSIVLTLITIVVAIVIGVIQLLSLVRNVAEPSDYYDVIGAAICASFIVFGGLSVLLYSPWRRYIDKRRERNNLDAENQEEEHLLPQSRSEEESPAI
jgi:nickel/cobalt transporter (NiCoT) family protein